MTRSLNRSLARATMAVCCIGLAGPVGDDVTGDHGGGSGGVSSDPARANKDLAIGDGVEGTTQVGDGGGACISNGQMQQDGGTTFIDGGTKVISDGRDYGDEDPRELEPA